MDRNSSNSGTYTVAATPVATTITLGFKPRKVEVWNETDLARYEHIYGQTDAYAYKTANHDTTQNSIITSGGITLTGDGFTVGTGIGDTASDVIRWVAYR